MERPNELNQALAPVLRAIDEVIRSALRAELAAFTGGVRQPNPTPPISEWLTSKKVALHLGVSEATVYSWRAKGNGPPWTKFGRLVRYKTSNVDAWAEGRLPQRRNRRE